MLVSISWLHSLLLKQVFTFFPTGKNLSCFVCFLWQWMGKNYIPLCKSCLQLRRVEGNENVVPWKYTFYLMAIILKAFNNTQCNCSKVSFDKKMCSLSKTVPKLDPSYKTNLHILRIGRETDLDFGDCFGREITRRICILGLL